MLGLAIEQMWTEIVERLIGIEDVDCEIVNAKGQTAEKYAEEIHSKGPHAWDKSDREEMLEMLEAARNRREEDKSHKRPRLS